MGLTSFDGSLFNQLDELYLNDNSFTELSISARDINVENLGSIKKLELTSCGEFGSIAMSGTTADTLSLKADDLCSFRANGCGFDSLPNVVAESEKYARSAYCRQRIFRLSRSARIQRTCGFSTAPAMP